jgi:two-component system response regulator ResD
LLRGDNLGKLKVLVIDDEWNMRNLLRIYLTKEGFEVSDTQNGTEGLALIKDSDFDVILLDIMMPDIDGYQVCKKIREMNQTPIIMLTARFDTKDKVLGLGMGADDYLVKPFEADELIARIYALVRRSRNALEDVIQESKYLLTELEVYPDRRQVIIQEQAVDFTQKEFDIIVLLVKNKHRAFSRDQIIEIIWGIDYLGDSRVVDSHIKNVREKVQRAGLSYNPIQTVWGVGYKWVVPMLSEH